MYASERIYTRKNVLSTYRICNCYKFAILFGKNRLSEYDKQAFLVSSQHNIKLITTSYIYGSLHIGDNSLLTYLNTIQNVIFIRRGLYKKCNVYTYTRLVLFSFVSQSWMYITFLFRLAQKDRLDAVLYFLKSSHISWRYYILSIYVRNET